MGTLHPISQPFWIFLHARCDFPSTVRSFSIVTRISWAKIWVFVCVYDTLTGVEFRPRLVSFLLALSSALWAVFCSSCEPWLVCANVVAVTSARACCCISVWAPLWSALTHKTWHRRIGLCWWTEGRRFERGTWFGRSLSCVVSVCPTCFIFQPFPPFNY